MHVLSRWCIKQFHPPMNIFLAELIFATGQEKWKKIMEKSATSSSTTTKDNFPVLPTIVEDSVATIRSKELRIAVFVREDISRGMFSKWNAKNAMVSCKFSHRPSCQKDQCCRYNYGRDARQHNQFLRIAGGLRRKSVPQLV